jgi:hypothetical protein
MEKSLWLKGDKSDQPLSGVEVTYIGNEGFLLQGNGKKVLIDALYRGGFSGYLVIPIERRIKMETSQPPFNDIDRIGFARDRRRRHCASRG